MDNDTTNALRAALESDTVFRAEFAAAASSNEAAAIAARHGWQVTVAEIEALSQILQTSSDRGLSDAELDSVSGGKPKVSGGKPTLNSNSTHSEVIAAISNQTY